MNPSFCMPFFSLIRDTYLVNTCTGTKEGVRSVDLPSTFTDLISRKRVGVRIRKGWFRAFHLNRIWILCWYKMAWRVPWHRTWSEQLGTLTSCRLVETRSSIVLTVSWGSFCLPDHWEECLNLTHSSRISHLCLLHCSRDPWDHGSPPSWWCTFPPLNYRMCSPWIC